MNRLLRERRLRALLTQAELAERVGVAEVSVRRWEAGHRPQPIYRRKLCDALAASPRELGFLLDDQGRSAPEEPPSTYEIDARVADSQRDWLRTRLLLNQNRSELTQVAAQLYPSSTRLSKTGILIPQEWRFTMPVALTSVDLAFSDVPQPTVTGRHEETRQLRPLVSPGRHYETYHHAMRDLARPRLFENRVCYRLLGVERSDDEGRLTLGYMRYFDMIDVGEALAHELALVAIDHRGHGVGGGVSWERLPFRRLVRDPFDLRGYPLLLSISTLTIRDSRAGATFVLLRRNVEQVAIAGGMLSVMPTGVFQPASILPTRNSPDLDVWRNMMREYSEEFLGNPDHDGSGDPIDYENEEPFRSLNAARNAGRIRVLCLGVGVDALNLVGDVLTVAVFDADVYDEVFHGLVEVNEEGTVTSRGQNRGQFTFDEPTIDHLLATEAMAPSGAACLELAWQHRESVLT